MEWLNPAGIWAWLGIPVVIALYLLRRKATQHEVPSLLLWQRTEGAQEAMKPFQRLRKQWLLILQLLLVALLALALLRPAMTGGLHGEMVLIMDVSASMQTKSNGQTRLGAAVEDALALLDGMRDGDAVTVLTAGRTVGQALSRSTDQSKIRAALSALEAENGTADMTGALSLALAMKRDLPELAIVVYTEEAVEAQDGVQVRNVGTGENNRSLISLRCTEQGDEMMAFARIANYGAACDVTVECYADGALTGIQTVALPEGEQQSVQMRVPQGARIVWMEIATEDALMADNTCYWVAQEAAGHNVLLVSNGNVFMEKALALREDLVVYKTNSVDAANMTGYDLYVLDGECPDPLPSEGAILALAPNHDIGGIQLGAEKKADGMLRAGAGSLAQELTQNLLLSEISLRAYSPLSGGQSVLTWDGDTLLAVQDVGRRRFAVLGFDLHDSNLPMKADFPILMQNLLDYLLPPAVTTVGAGACGEALQIALNERSQSAVVVTPSGREVPVQSSMFAETNEIGVYVLCETDLEGEQRVTPFALHMAPSEADVRHVAMSVQDEELGRVERTGGGNEGTIYLLLAFLLLMLVEWGVSRRGV